MTDGVSGFGWEAKSLRWYKCIYGSFFFLLRYSPKIKKGNIFTERTPNNKTRRLASGKPSCFSDLFFVCLVEDYGVGVVTEGAVPPQTNTRVSLIAPAEI